MPSAKIEDEIEVDARDHRCPVPTLRLRRALEAATPGSVVRLLADDPLARIDVPHFAQQAGYDVVDVAELEKGWAFRVRRSSPLGEGDHSERGGGGL
jgi:tRNA 2-thiouridine synthesizing protein A